MKNKISIIIILAFVFAFVNSVSAVSGNTGGSQNQTDQQTKILNQSENSQIQVQSGTTNQVGSGTHVQTQTQTQQKLQDGTGTSSQNQNQVKNQGETNQIQINEQEGVKGQNDGVVEQRRSQVASAVQQMLQVAERNGGIGQQVKTIAQTQTQNQEKLETSLQKVQSRGGFSKFFVGPNYSEINNAQKLLEQNREQIKQLNQIKIQLSNQGDAQTLVQQIQTLEQANLQIENSLKNEQKGFSLFGWVFRLSSN